MMLLVRLREMKRISFVEEHSNDEEIQENFEYS